MPVLDEIKVEGLLGLDVGGKSDPYVQVYCDHPAVLPRPVSTPHHAQTLQTKWGKDEIPAVVLRTSVEDAAQMHLVLAVIDHDIGPQSVNEDDLLGQCILPMKDVLKKK